MIQGGQPFEEVAEARSKTAAAWAAISDIFVKAIW